VALFDVGEGGKDGGALVRRDRVDVVHAVVIVDVERARL
jgi:hypothetical protein